MDVPSLHSQNTQFQLADMATKVEAAKSLVYKAALKKQEFADGAKVSYSVEAAMAKLYAAEVAMEVTTKSSSVAWWLWLHQRI